MKILRHYLKIIIHYKNYYLIKLSLFLSKDLLTNLNYPNRKINNHRIKKNNT